MGGHRNEHTVDAVGCRERPAVVRTILFSDVVDSTSYAEANGDESYARLLDEHDRIVHWALERSGGLYVKATGDGAMLAFLKPDVAVDAAVAIQLGSMSAGIPLRIGIDHGPVIEYCDGDFRGLVANIAARLSSMAAAGQVTVTDRVVRAARLAGPTHPCSIRGVRACQRVRTLTVSRVASVG